MLVLFLALQKEAAFGELTKKLAGSSAITSAIMYAAIPSGVIIVLAAIVPCILCCVRNSQFKKAGKDSALKLPNLNKQPVVAAEKLF